MAYLDPLRDFDPTYTTLAHRQDVRWSFDKLAVLFAASLVGPLLIVYLAAKIMAG